MSLDRIKGILTSIDPAAEAAASAKLDPSIRALLESNSPEGVEDHFLRRIDESPLDVEFFVPIIRHFAKNRKSDTAEVLLQLLLDTYRERRYHNEEITLLRAVLTVWPESAPARKSLAEQYASLYADCPNRKKLFDHFKVDTAPNPPAAFRALESWLRYDEGRGVYMTTRGVGRVREINLSLSVIRVVFLDDPTPVSFKPDEAERLLEPLANGHFLLDKLDRIQTLQELAEKDAGELLRRLFSSINRKTTVAELKGLLAGIIPAAKWSSWWTQAKSDRRLTVDTGNVCTWNDSADDADAELLRKFQAAPPREKLEMAKKYGKRSPRLTAQTSSELFRIAGQETAENPALSLEILLTLEKMPGVALEELPSAIAGLIGANAVSAWIAAVGDRIVRKRAIALVRENRDDWPAFYGELLKTETDSTSIGMMYDALKSTGNENLLDECIKEIFAGPAKAPDFFLWLCRSLPEREELRTYANWNLLQLLFSLLNNDTIKAHNASLRKLFDPGGAVDCALRMLDEDVSKRFMAQLERDSSIEDYRKERLLNDLRGQFPEAKKTGDTIFYVTPESLEERQAEFIRITSVDIPKNTEEIVKARAHGDLRENFEYHAARAKQEMLSSRAKTLHDLLQCARPLDSATVDTSSVCAGTSVRLVAETGEEICITILGPWDSDPAGNIISYQAPAVMPLLGKRKGDRVLFSDQSYTVHEIRAWK